MGWITLPLQKWLMSIKLWIWMINAILLVISPSATLSEAVPSLCLSICNGLHSGI